MVSALVVLDLLTRANRVPGEAGRTASKYRPGVNELVRYTQAGKHTLASFPSVVMPVKVKTSGFLQKGARGSSGSKNHPIDLDSGQLIVCAPPSSVPGEKRIEVPNSRF